MGAETDDRLSELETQLAFQEEEILRLSDALIAQQTRMDQLEALLDELLKRVAAAGEPDIMSAEDEPPPPHY